jgi:hypothetical protein
MAGVAGVAGAPVMTAAAAAAFLSSPVQRVQPGDWNGRVT